MEEVADFFVYQARVHLCNVEFLSQQVFTKWAHAILKWTPNCLCTHCVLLIVIPLFTHSVLCSPPMQCCIRAALHYVLYFKCQWPELGVLLWQEASCLVALWFSAYSLFLLFTNFETAALSDIMHIILFLLVLETWFLLGICTNEQLFDYSPWSSH